MFFRLKKEVNYGTVRRQAGAEVSSLEGFFFRSQQHIQNCLYMYTCVDVISPEEYTTENTKHQSAP